MANKLYLADYREILEQAELLTPENVKIFSEAEHVYSLASGDSGSLASGLRTLHEAGILTQDNFTALIEKAEHATFLAIGLRILHEARMLTQDNFTALIEKASALTKIEPFLLTQTDPLLAH